MVALQGGFDARQIQPDQGIPTHPVGKFPAYISNTEIKQNSENTGGFFAVEFTTQAGKIVNRYNFWHANPQVMEIAQKQLSALCHATGVFQVSWQDEGAGLRNAQLQIEVTKQKGSEYTQVSRVYDVNGNEPGKAPANAPQPAAPAAPGPGPAPGAGWGAPGGQPMQPPAPAAPTAPAPAPAPAPGGWGASPAGPAPGGFPGAPQQPAPWGGPAAPGAPAAAPAAPGWQQQPGGPGPAPWGPR